MFRVGAPPRSGAPYADASSSTNGSSSSDCKTGAALSGTGGPDDFDVPPGRSSLSSSRRVSCVCALRRFIMVSSVKKSAARCIGSCRRGYPAGGGRFSMPPVEDSTVKCQSRPHC
jgi:hypothetical protein